MVEIHIARNGEVIGVYGADQLTQAMKIGAVLPADVAWHEGLTEWIPVAQVGASGDGLPLAATDKKKAKSNPGTPGDWRLDPATDKQLTYIATLGGVAPAGLTKGGASDLIERLKDDPRLQEERWDRANAERLSFPSFYFRKEIAQARESLASEKAERDRLKQEVSDCTRSLRDAQKKLTTAADETDRESYQAEVADLTEELETLKSDLAAAPETIKFAQEDLKEALAPRIQFWKATFKKTGAEVDGDDDLLEYWEIIDQLYVAFGHYFKTPTSKQVTDILSALDKASTDWDKTQPHAFYATLQDSFPELQKAGGGAKPGADPARSAPPPLPSEVAVPSSPVVHSNRALPGSALRQPKALAKGKGCVLLVCVPILLYLVVHLISLIAPAQS